MHKEEVITALEDNKDKIHDVMDIDFDKAFVFDFGKYEKGQENDFDINDTEGFTKYIFETLNVNNVPAGIGRYNEVRKAYSELEFFGTEDRTVHMGIDIWAKAGTPISAPLQGKVHSFRNNDNHGDYGPTIILEHELDGVNFYTLYGHLSVESLEELEKGQDVSAGQKIASIGAQSENGGWPPHLHFQIMPDMQGMEGDFPGVCSIEDREKFLELCLDPNLILGVKGL